MVLFFYIFLYKIDLGGFRRIDIIQKFDMPIRIYVDYIYQVDYDRIIDYYNSNIPFDQAKLEILDRCEGGFQIQCPRGETVVTETSNNCDGIKSDCCLFVDIPGFQNTKN